MGWTPKTVTPPIPDAAVSVVSAISAASSTVGSALGAVSSALDAAKIFYTAGIDIYQTLTSTIITEAENLNNDIFGSGGFQLIVDPFSLVSNRFLEEGEGKDQYGIPYLTPQRAISAAIRSFDDLLDDNRPQFSDSATVSAFGLMVTVPEPSAFILALESLLSVWNLDDMVATIERVKFKTKGSNQKKSVPVDWSSVKFNQIKALGDIQRENNKALAIAKGYLTVGDNVIVEMIDAIQRKVDVLSDSVATFQDLIDTLLLAAGIPNVFVLDVPIGIGGNRKIKAALRDSALEALVLNKYTFMILYVGGGPSAQGVDNIRKLIV